MLHTAGYADDIYDNKEIFLTGVRDLRRYIQIVCCGHDSYTTNSAHALRPDGRLDYQLIYISSGKASFSFDSCIDSHIHEKTVMLHKGYTALYKPGERNDYKYDHLYSTEAYWVHFTGYGAETVLSEANLNNGSYFYAGICETIICVFDSIIREMQLKSPYYQLNVSSLFMHLISLMSRNILLNDAPDKIYTDEGIAKTIERMRRDFYLNIPITEYASECNMSINWFISRFKKQTGHSPLRFINSLKIEKAKYLLSNTQISIREIAAITGYDNIYYFSQSFKNHTGMPPGKFRETYGNAAGN